VVNQATQWTMSRDEYVVVVDEKHVLAEVQQALSQAKLYQNPGTNHGTTTTLDIRMKSTNYIELRDSHGDTYRTLVRDIT
jgi:hypothetical protein